MTTRENVLDALGSVMEPTLRQSIAALGLVRDVVVRENGVSLTVVLHPDSLGQSEAVERNVTLALKNLHSGTPHIRIRAMTDHEKSEMQAKQGGQASAPQSSQGAAPVKGHAAGLETSPLLAPGSKTQFIAIASGKGGVGKSTVTVNLAVALARSGKRVGLMDCDIYGFSVPDMMGIEERPVQVGDKIKPIERFGVKVISMGFFVEDNSPVVWRGPMLGRMLRNFFAEIDWGELDYVLLDLPPGTGDVALDVHQILPHSKEIIVTTPHATAAFVAARAGAMAIKTNHEVLGVVENMAWYESRSTGEREYVFGRGGGGLLAETLHVDLLAQFPLGAPENHPAEPDFSPSVYKADTPTGREYLELANKVIERCGN
ncbi:iron-sulfur cluster carrier protein [Cohnella xylanilytica]|uniref:Iron-sulfur cluster carrier protein n=1 Tax=Cohnella xylanilytica TaxID=557555 RepID=A0A841U793_9BACL|nr:Mrp/NBP35 family ATP-binding protein [Cohnella xylanilytica]MBB6693944.1 Mrp/NBP35 family ATP-binding protein [Cohnella xylanilytica]GIO15331.1 iron-sulfur cluster carrier protein [Cohnella xylanilytica]